MRSRGIAHRLHVPMVLALALVPAIVEAQAHQHPDGSGVPHAGLGAQLDRVRAATVRYRDHSAAVADGYVRFGGDGPLMGEHWYRRDLVRAPLDLERPSTLQYAWIEGRRELVGVAYTVHRTPTEPIPAGFDGDADHWHVHDVARIGDALTEGRPVLRGLMERARRLREPLEASRTHLTMLHAWVWLENPDGVFAQEHRALPYLRAGLPVTWAGTGDAAAARGTALLSEGACRDEVRRIAALARPDRRQQRALRAACDEAAAAVRTARVEADGAAAFNGAAGAAWRDFEDVRTRTLTPMQRTRLQSIVEHPDGGDRH